ncbi:prolyl oligopeptidase family serine peptidase [Novosphingobium sp. B 225]|uniref:prolyl oligopeptidase family serine peptidase n=1 Tax=Novosphingobium sp. B 225 TaxID=1961849 RepID=UPI003F8E1197
MIRPCRALLGGLLLLGAGLVQAKDMQPITYPETQRGPVVETIFGEQLADPYRWLEGDVRTEPAVADWVKRQNAVTQDYLGKLPERPWFARRIRQLLDYERFGLPVKAGKAYFYTRNSGLQNQSQLFVRTGLDGAPRMLLDPNSWARDGATALDDWEPAHDGSLLAYTVQDGGSDWRTIRVVDAASGKVLADEIKWAKFTNIAWIGSSGFLYSRFPEPREGQAFQQLNTGQEVRFHRIGTPQSADTLVYATPDRPELGHFAQVTHDQRWALITTSRGTDNRFELHVIPLGRHGKPKGWTAQPLVTGLDHDWRLIEGMGNQLWFVTNKGAPRLKVVATDLKHPERGFVDVIREREETLERAQIVGNQLILNYLKDAASMAEMVSLDGRRVQTIALNAIGAASGFTGRPGDPETFYSFSSFNQPSAVFRYDSSTGKTQPFAQPKLGFDPADYGIEQRFYTSKDGTRVPMFLVRKHSVAAAGKAVPTLLYGYGGFDIALTPSFSAARMAWLEAGGAFALANLRGGGEYGKAWHDAGRLHNKQNVFDDFIAAGEYLIAQGVTPRGGLAIQGGSNGGLLVGAVVNQRPDLFAAASPAVGVMDMLRFDRFTAGRYWVDDYGHPGNEADFRVLRGYSPYHNIAGGRDYPAVLVTTADTDDRVVPGHSFKYAAALQAAALGPKPHLIRIESRAGHGAGKPTDKAVAENADVLGFLAHWTGLAVPGE